MRPIFASKKHRSRIDVRFLCILLLILISTGPLAEAEQFFNAVLAGNVEEVRKYLTNNPKLLSEYDPSGETALTAAAKYGDELMLECLLKMGAEINEPDKSGETALHWAVSRSHNAVVSILTDNKANVDAIDKEGKTPLFRAVYYENTDAAICLLAAGANVNAVDACGGSALHYAISTHKVKIAEFLISHGANIDAFTLVVSGKVDELEHLISLSPDILHTNLDGESLLHLAASWGQVKIVNFLLNRGLSPNITLPNYGITPLVSAVEYKQSLAVELLLKRGADVNCRTEKGEVPLEIAAAIGAAPIAQTLLHYGADPSLKDDDGNCALHKAAANGYPEIVRLLISAKVDPDVRNRMYDTPLHLAVMETNEEVIRILLQSGASVNARNLRWRTPLHIIAANCPDETNLLNILLINGANVNSKDIAGRTALHLACVNNSFEFVKELVHEGADVNAWDWFGATPLEYYYAHCSDDVKISKFLRSSGGRVFSYQYFLIVLLALVSIGSAPYLRKKVKELRKSQK